MEALFQNSFEKVVSRFCIFWNKDIWAIHFYPTYYRVQKTRGIYVDPADRT